MADYPESTKQSIGDLVLKIHDLENKLTELRRRGADLVKPLRAIADLFDQNQRNSHTLILTTDSHFATTDPDYIGGHRIIIEGKNYPA